MNLSWLEDFLALAASGHFSRAAEERHMTQPAFSRRIRALEAWLGTELFDRSSQPATLTASGRWFTDVANELLVRVARVPGEARAVAQAQATTLRFAATHALSFTFLPGWLRRLERGRAMGPIALVSDVFARGEAMLLQGQVQFLLCHAHERSPSDLQVNGYPFCRVGTDWLIPVAVPDAAGQPQHRLPVAAGDAAPALVYSAESGLGRILRDVLPDRLAMPGIVQADLASVLRTMALDGRGVAWLPDSLIADDLAAGRLVDAAPLAARIELEIRLYRDRSPLGQAAEAFWADVSAAAAS